MANLSEANLVQANLCFANMAGANLGKTDLTKARITGAVLYETNRDDWKIDGIQCEYVYWDEDGKIRTPKDRDFHPGEFEEICKNM